VTDLDRSALKELAVGCTARHCGASQSEGSGQAPTSLTVVPNLAHRDTARRQKNEMSFWLRRGEG
jgi:hypothetical protein